MPAIRGNPRKYESDTVPTVPPVLLGIVAAYLVAAALSITGVYAPGAPGYVDLESVLAASETRLAEMTMTTFSDTARSDGGGTGSPVA
ncbi:hypothetical protein C8039_14515 [Halogeometricum sp. wsp3]|nr:hypothetical protein C8039_14515 [Halogeometricum sp. wsp3]